MKKLLKLLTLIFSLFLFISSVNAASATISVNTSASQVIVGNNVNVSVTISSSFSDTPNIFDTMFVDIVKNFTNGAAIIDNILIKPTAIFAILFEYFIANLFGTSSPNTNEKYESINVTIIIDTLFQNVIPSGNHLSNTGANFVANASDANALDKNPASVIPICIVAKNLLGS